MSSIPKPQSNSATPPVHGDDLLSQANSPTHALTHVFAVPVNPTIFLDYTVPN